MNSSTHGDRFSMRRSDARHRMVAGLQVLLYAVVYVCLAELSQRVSYPNSFPPLWLPSGLAMAVFASTPPRRWPLWIVGSIVANIVYNGWLEENSAGVVFGFATANLSRTLLGAWLLQSLLPGRLRLSSVRDVLIFTVAGGVVPPLVTAFIGALTLHLAYDTPWLESVPAWFAGNVVGIMLLSPLSLVVIRRCQRISRSCDCGGPQDRRSLAYFLTLTVVLLIASLLVFRISTAPLSFLLAPFMIWLTIRFELFGAVTSCFVVAMVLLACTSVGYGPIAIGRPAEMQLLLSQGFLVTISLTSLILAAVVQRHRRAMRRIEYTQKQLKELQRETQLILDTIPSMVFYQDRNNRILRANRSAAKWLGLPRQQIAGRRLPEISGSGSRESGSDDSAAISTRETQFRETQFRETQLSGEETVTLPNGQTRWVQADRVALGDLGDRENQPRPMVVVLTDISDRKAAEMELERSNLDLERYAFVASHDLKEPLRAVSGYCRFLQEDYSDMLDSEGKRFIEKAIEGADRMQQMISDLLEYSRISRAEIPVEAVDLNQVIGQVRCDLQQSIQDSGARITVDELPTVIGCRCQLSQLFQNLISNSLKFVSAEKAPQIHVSSDSSPEEIGVTVSDNGLGIATENQRRIFEIFQRLHRRSEYLGTGLGLAICERIMQRHHGRIEVASELDQGSQFRLVFPRHRETQATSQISPIAK